MHPPWVYEASDGVLVVYNGVTRATRIAKLSPGTLIRVEVVGKLRRACAGYPKSWRHSAMSANVRQEALDVLAEIAALAPEVRLGQLMAHLGFLSEDQVERSLWDIEDDQLLAVLDRHRGELLARQQITPNHSSNG
jgi:hypothetical protein